MKSRTYGHTYTCTYMYMYNITLIIHLTWFNGRVEIIAHKDLKDGIDTLCLYNISKNNALLESSEKCL